MKTTGLGTMRICASELKRWLNKGLGIFILVFSGVGHAGMVEVPTEGLQRVVVKGWDANVTVTPQAKTNVIRINGVDDQLTPGLYIVEKKGSILEVHINEWTSKSEWRAQLGAKKGRRNIEISGASLPVEIDLKDGHVQLTKATKEARVMLTTGKVIASDCQAPLDIFLHAGEVTVQNQSGKVKIDQYQGQTNVRSMQGDLDLSAFNSQVNIEKVRGLISLNTQSSLTKVLQSSGTVQLDNGKGLIHLNQFQGRVEGSTQEGTLNVSLQPESEVHLRSASGRIQVQLPPSSGAALNLATNEGEISVPGGAKINRTATEKNYRGKLPGDVQKATVTVRSQEGTIVIK